MPPFREDPSLYYYGGLVCVYLAQEEMDRMRSQGGGAGRSQTQGSQPGLSVSQSQGTRRGASSGSSSSSSASSSSSSSSSSSDAEDQAAEGVRPDGKGKGKQRGPRQQPARMFNKPVSTETMHVLERESVHWTMEARRWFEKALEAAEEGQRASASAAEAGLPQWRTGVAREVDEAQRWLDLVRACPSQRYPWLNIPRLADKEGRCAASPLSPLPPGLPPYADDDDDDDDMRRWTARSRTSACRLPRSRQVRRVPVKSAVPPHVLELLPAMCLFLPLLLYQIDHPRQWTKRTSMSLIPAPIDKVPK